MSTIDVIQSITRHIVLCIVSEIDDGARDVIISKIFQDIKTI